MTFPTECVGWDETDLNQWKEQRAYQGNSKQLHGLFAAAWSNLLRITVYFNLIRMLERVPYAAVSRGSLSPLTILWGRQHPLNYRTYFIASLCNILMSSPECFYSIVSLLASFAPGCHPHLKLGTNNPSFWRRCSKNSSFTQPFAILLLYSQNPQNDHDLWSFFIEELEKRI